MRGKPLALFAAGALAACAPTLEGPVERARAADRADGDRLAAALGELPGVVAARVVLRRPVADPLGGAPPGRGGAAVVLATDDHAPGDLRDRARALTRAVAPELADDAVAVVAAPRIRRAEVVELGPFTVAATSRGRLRAALAALLALVAALAGHVAWRSRPRRAAR